MPKVLKKKKTRETLIDKHPTEWILPSKSCTARWSGFLMAKERNQSAGRRYAKCSYCNLVMHGKPHALKTHMINDCGSIPGNKKSEYINTVSTAASDGESDADLAPNTANTANNIETLKPKIIHNFTNSSLHHFCHRSQAKMNEIYEDLCLALISGRVPFSFVDNEHFHRFQQRLSLAPFTPASRYVMINRILPTLHAQSIRKMRSDISQKSGLTLSLDGWADTCHNSVYALMILQGNHTKHFIDNLRLHQIRHTSENIKSAVDATLEQSCITWDQIAAIVTDNPSPMVKLRRMIHKANPHVFGIPCALHFFNLIAKDFINHKDMKPIVENNKELVKHFTVSYYWDEHLEPWKKKEGVTHSIQKSCDSRWYTFTKVCISVDAYENGFLKCVEIAQDESIDSPTMPKEISQLVQNRNHFTANKALVLFLKPVVDSLARLECATTTLGDIWKELCILYKTISNINLSIWPGYSTYQQYCLNILNKRAHQYDEPIFIVAFFLTPSCRQVAVSGIFPIKVIQKYIVKIAYHWNYSQADAITMADQARLYLDGEGHFGTSKKFSLALKYWLDLPMTMQTNLLKQFAIKMLEIIPHAAGIEGLFSAMSATKTKGRAAMTVTNLKMISQVQLSDANTRKLQKSKTTNSTVDIEVVKDHDIHPNEGFLGPDQLLEFEKGEARQYEEDLTSTLEIEDLNYEGFISTLFDLKLFQYISFEQVQSNCTSAPVGGAPGSWNPDEIVFE